MATDDKYDRQLRLWGAHGQKLLSEAKVCVLGSSPIATETLKNLVLPGVGNVTLVDAAKVELADLGHNFFLEASDVGRNRAEACCAQLLEMNPDVSGEFVAKDPAQLVEQEPGFFNPFSLVIACQLTEVVATKLCSICQALGTPLVLITSIGFIGKLRLYAAEHCIIEAKPDSELGDLRLTDPFPELRRFADSIALSLPAGADGALNDVEHGHVPYVVVLLKAIDAFRERHNGELPKNKEEKDAFKKIIEGMRWNDKEMNFQEALDNAYKAWVPYTIPDGAQGVLAADSSDATTDFWIVGRAIAKFVQDCGKLPLAGTLPDMTATTDQFVKLQEIYTSRAEGDCAAIQAHIAQILNDLGSQRTISPEYVKRFCQNAQYCEVIRFRTLAEEFNGETANGDDIACEVMDEESNIQWYLALRAVDKFREENGHYPGEKCGDEDEAALASDLAGLQVIANKLVGSYSAEGITVEPRYLEEMVRYGGCELHVTSSVLGGIASQEAVKLITKQFIPLNNSYIHNGLHGRGQNIEL